MLDRQTGEKVTIHTDGTAGPYVPIGLAQLNRVTRVLNACGIRYTVDRDAIRMDGEPVTAVINLGNGTDITKIQEALDSVPDREEEDQPEQVVRLRQTATRAIVRAAIELVPSFCGISLNLYDLFPKKRAERQKTVEECKTQLVKELTDAGIDPVMFDILLTNEMDRRMKIHFGIGFLVLTVLFTAASYAIVILDAVFAWKISSAAITALIIETPIQFIGLLYVIARNLFPGNDRASGSTKDKKTRV